MSRRNRKVPQQALAALRGKLAEFDGDSQRVRRADDLVSCGCVTLDQSLPRGGFQRGQLIEWLSAHPGSGACSWALQSCRALTTGKFAAQAKAVVVIDPSQTFYPPAAFGMGIDLERLIIIRPKNSADAMWALDQCLRCSAVAAACAVMPRLDPRDFRRLQLAAEQGSTIGHLLRPLSVRGQPSWSDLQLLVRPQWRRERQSDQSATVRWKGTVQSARRQATRNQGCTGPPLASCRSWQIELLRCKGGKPGAVVEVTGDITNGKWLSPDATEYSPLSNSTPAPSKLSSASPLRISENEQSCQKSNAVHLAAELARPANPRRATRA